MKLLTVFIVLLFSIFTFGQSEAAKSKMLDSPLVLSGEVKNVEISQSEHSEREVLLKVDLRLSFTNTSTENVIFLSGYNECNQVTLSKSNGERLAVSGGPTSSFLPKWKTIDDKLNKSVPPENLSQIIIPKGVWSFDHWFKRYIPIKDDRVVKESFDEKGNPETTITTQIPFGTFILEEIENLSPIYLQVECEAKPVWIDDNNKLADGSDFFRKLDKKWRNFGNLWVGELISKPMVFDINQAKRK